MSSTDRIAGTSERADAYVRRQALWSQLLDLFKKHRPTEEQLAQVSTIAPEWSGRWTKSRRLHVAWEMLQHVRPAHLITHRFPLAQASQAYALLDQHPEEAIQVLFTYGE